MKIQEQPTVPKQKTNTGVNGVKSYHSSSLWDANPIKYVAVYNSNNQRVPPLGEIFFEYMKNSPGFKKILELNSLTIYERISDKQK